MKLLFVGDSNTLGLGAGGSPFAARIEAALTREMSIDVRNAAINGSTVVDQVAQLDDYLAWGADVAVLWVGGADALSIPRRDRRFDLVRLLPRRYRQLGWLQPRPYLPSRWWKRELYARPESYVRTLVGRAIMRLQGVRTVLPFEQFEPALTRLVEAFRDAGTSVIMCGPGPVDDAIFPGAEASFARFDAVVRLVSKAFGCTYVEIAPAIRDAQLLLRDRFHPNARGHEAVAAVLLPIVRDAIARRRGHALSSER